MANPNSLAVTAIAARWKVAIDGVGSAIFRNAWKDSDAAQNIHGFVSVEAQNQGDEESLVWLVATLGLHGLPFFNKDYNT